MEQNENSLTVMLVDDRIVIREGIHSVLDAEEDIEVVAEAATAEEASTYLKTISPDVVIVSTRIAPPLAEHFNGSRVVLVGYGDEDGPQESSGVQAKCLAPWMAPGELVQSVRGYSNGEYDLVRAKQALKSRLLSLVEELYPVSA